MFNKTVTNLCKVTHKLHINNKKSYSVVIHVPKKEFKNILQGFKSLLHYQNGD